MSAILPFNSLALLMVQPSMAYPLPWKLVLPKGKPMVPLASFKAPVNPFETAFQRGALNPGGGGGQQQQQLASVSAAEINNPVVKLAGLILGSPEFQRQ